MQTGSGVNKDWPTILAGEMLLFQLLGRTFYLEPDIKWYQELIKEGVFTEVPFSAHQEETILGLESLQRWADANRDGITAGQFDDLKFDYTRMFIGLQKTLAAPWESVYFNHSQLVFQEQTIQVREWYRRFNLVPEKLGREPDDHIGLELMFLAHLSNLALQAMDRNDEQDFEAALQAQRDFLTQHLLRWGPAWCRLVKTQAQTDLYRGLAHLAHGALIEVAGVLQIQMPAEVSL